MASPQQFTFSGVGKTYKSISTFRWPSQESNPGRVILTSNDIVLLDRDVTVMVVAGPSKSLSVGGSIWKFSLFY